MGCPLRRLPAPNLACHTSHSLTDDPTHTRVHTHTHTTPWTTQPPALRTGAELEEQVAFLHQHGCPQPLPASTARNHCHCTTTTTTATRTHPHPLPVLSCWPASAAARRAAICSNYYLNLPGRCNQKRSETIRLDQKRSSMRHTIVCRGRQHIDRASLGSWYYRCSRATGSSGCSGHGAGCPLPPHTPTRAHTHAHTHAHSQTDRQTDTYTYEHTHTSTYPPSFPHVGTRLLLLWV